jgi:hypothetical protein
MYPYGGLPYGAPYAYPLYGSPYGAYSPYPQTMTADQEAEMLKAQAEELKGGLEEINRRISELESEAAKKK